MIFFSLQLKLEAGNFNRMGFNPFQQLAILPFPGVCVQPGQRRSQEDKGGKTSRNDKPAYFPDNVNKTR